MTGIRQTPVLRQATGQEEWRSRARCLDTDSELFYPDAELYVGRAALVIYAAARAICQGRPHQGCPVRKQCLEFALDTEQMVGVWGGFTPADRERMLQTRAVRRAEQSMR